MDRVFLDWVQCSWVNIGQLIESLVVLNAVLTKAFQDRVRNDFLFRRLSFLNADGPVTALPKLHGYVPCSLSSIQNRNLKIYFFSGQRDLR